MSDDDVARLLAHPLRQRLLFEYRQACSPSKVARRIDEPVNVVSYHTNVLRRRGWLELVRTEQRRGATESYYLTTRDPKVEDEAWRRISRPLRHAVVLGTLGITSDEARAAALDGGFDGAAAHLSRSVVELDEQGVAEVAEALREVIDRIERSAVASRARQADAARRYELVIQYFRVPEDASLSLQPQRRQSRAAAAGA
jgi:DNA-binding transcriptional ArsR family regulator